MGPYCILWTHLPWTNMHETQHLFCIIWFHISSERLKKNRNMSMDCLVLQDT